MVHFLLVRINIKSIRLVSDRGRRGMSDCIDTITSLMPATSNFDGSDVQKILDETVGVYFDNLEEEIERLIDAPFLTEADGEYLDLIHGKLYGISRKPDEEDDDYRQRMIFHAKDGVRVGDLLDLGCNVYTYYSTYNDSPNFTLLSRNTNLTSKYFVECPSDDIEELIKDNFIWEGVLYFI